MGVDSYTGTIRPGVDKAKPKTQEEGLFCIL